MARDDPTESDPTRDAVAEGRLLPSTTAVRCCSGLSPQAGIYCAIVTGLIISSLGGSLVQIGGPTGAFVVVVSDIVARHGVSRLDAMLRLAPGRVYRFGEVIVRYAPRRVTLPPNQPQSIRIGLTQMQDLPDGEYRAHMLFRAIPKTASVVETQDAGNGVQIQLIPVYGVTIPIIVRKGKLNAQAALANPRIENDEDGPALKLDLSRKGDQSVFGEIRVTKPGVAEPVMLARGIAVYPEVDSRIVALPINAEIAAQLKGPVTIGYYEAVENGGALISEVKSVLN